MLVEIFKCVHGIGASYLVKLVNFSKSNNCSVNLFIPRVTWRNGNPEPDPDKNDQVGKSNIRGTYVWVGAPRREAAILPQEEIQGPMALGSL